MSQHPEAANQFQPSNASPTEQRTVGVLTHVVPAIAVVASVGTLGFVASLAVYLIYRDRGDFARINAANSLNVQIMTAIGLLISLPLMLILIGFITYPAVIVWGVVLHIIGAVRANNNELWNPPLTPRFVK